MPLMQQETTAPRLSQLAQELTGSEILRIFREVQALVASGREITDLTIGDFSPREFRIPKSLEDAVVDAYRAGECVYPPGMGLEALRAAIRTFYAHRLGHEFPLDRILVTAGARPAIYSLFRALVDPGDRVVYGVPSWNNNYYCQLLGAEAVPIACDASTNFLPTANALRRVIRGARLLSLNSPLNPTGTMFDADRLGAICDLVLEENARRGPDERPLFVMYDQVYWMLTAGGARHVEPIGLRPEMTPYVVLVDAISKAFAATGLRIGWAVAPADVIRSMTDIVGHMGAWAPRPEQVATSRVLSDHRAVDAYLGDMRRAASDRLQAAYDGLVAMRDAGLPVDCVRPQGAIYVSARFALFGHTTPDGQQLQTDDDVRRYLLNAAGLAAVPFGAFGAKRDQGWFRLSIGVVSVEGVEGMMPRIREAVEGLVAKG